MPRTRFACALLASTMLLPATALAQEQEPAVLEEIVVTAEKREASVQKVGIAITAMDEETVERLNTREMTAITAVVPNVVYGSQGLGPGVSQISIRGINSQDVEKSFDPAVGVFIDGVYLGSSAFNVLDSFDLDRVEVLRGPQGTLFGRNTTGGAISVYRTEPTGEFGGKVQATIGNANRRDIQFIANTPLFADAFAVKLGGYLQKDDGIFKNRSGGATGAKDRWGGTAALKYEPTDSFKAILTYDRAVDKSEIPPFYTASVATPSQLPIRITQTTFPTSPAIVYAALPADRFCTVPGGVCLQQDLSYSNSSKDHFIDADLDAVTGNVVWSPNDNYEFTAVLGWRQSGEVVVTDYDGTQMEVFGVRRVQDYEQKSGELRVASTYDGPFNFVAGVFAFESHYDLDQGQKVDRAMNATPAPPLGTVYSNAAGSKYDHWSESKAIFAQGDYEVLEGVTVTAGVRATWDKKRIYKYIMGAIPSTAPGAWYPRDPIPDGRPISSEGGGEEEWFNLTPKIAIRWQINPDVMTYASLTRGYNAGGFSGRAGTIPDSTTPFDPEYVTAFETGVKSTLLDGRARLNAAFFLNKFDDKQEDSITPIPAPLFTSTTVRNASTAEMAGVELEASALITDAFRVDASVGYLDARYTDFPAFLSSGQYVSSPAQPSGTLIAADFSTLRPRHAPRLSGSLTPSYTVNIGPGELILSATAKYLGERFVEFYNDPRGRVPAKTWVDASVSYEFSGINGQPMKLTVFGNNLGDIRSIQNFTSSIVDLRLPSAPRTWGVTLLARF